MNEDEMKEIWKFLYTKKEYQKVLAWWEGLKNE